MKTNYDVAIIGGGVIGASIARELSRYSLDVVVLERENDVCLGTSKANSAIVHAGYDPKEGSLMAKLNVEGNAMFTKLCKELDVPLERNGSLVVAFDDEQLAQIETLMERGLKNGVPDLKILSKEELLEMEPNISDEAKGALYAGTGGITDPMLLTISLMENAVANGVECLLNFDVQSIESENGIYKIASKDQEVTATYVINAAGVYADQVHNMAAPEAFKMILRRGQYFLLDKSAQGIVTKTVFPCPTKIGKGILVLPSVHGNVLLGPASDLTDDKDDVATTEETLYETRVGAKKLIPSVNPWVCIRQFSGLRAETDKDDFIIKEADGAPKFIDVAGIKSPGLTAAPAIATYTLSILKETGLDLIEKEGFDPIVKRKLLIEMTQDEQSALIKENPLYGRVICRCENITEGDILDAIHRKPGATTVDGVKRRCRAGMGRCQAGFCGPRVQQIIARELNKPLEEVVLEKAGSYILTGRTK